MTATTPGIIIVGLGPGDPESRTIGAQRALDRADRIIVRTRIHPGLDNLFADPRVTDCDDLYEDAEDFAGLYQKIAERVVAAAIADGLVVYAAPGHPRFGERTVPLIEAAALAAGIPVTVLDAVSFIDAAANSLGIDPLADGLQIADAEQIASTLDMDPFAASLLAVDPARPLLVGQIYNKELAAAVKIALARVFPDEHLVTVVQAAGVIGEDEANTIPLHALDREHIDHLTSVWVAPLGPLDAVRAPDTLTRVVARLRRPDGCPWDRKQDHASLRESVLEEAYEVVDAIDSGNGSELTEELGDLLLIIAMHAQIAEEEGSFRIEDVYEGISRKLIRRHPHVFADVVAESPDDVITTWEGVKSAEREAKGEPARNADPIDRLPRSMPVIRKIIEVLAPRATFEAPEQPSDGANALAEIAALIARGIDPERALETALRASTRQEQTEVDQLAGVGAASERGGTEA